MSTNIIKPAVKLSSTMGRHVQTPLRVKETFARGDLGYDHFWGQRITLYYRAPAKGTDWWNEANYLTQAEANNIYLRMHAHLTTLQFPNVPDPCPIPGGSGSYQYDYEWSPIGGTNGSSQLNFILAGGDVGGPPNHRHRWVDTMHTTMAYPPSSVIWTLSEPWETFHPKMFFEAARTSAQVWSRTFENETTGCHSHFYIDRIRIFMPPNRRYCRYRALKFPSNPVSWSTGIYTAQGRGMLVDALLNVTDWATMPPQETANVQSNLDTGSGGILTIISPAAYVRNKWDYPWDEYAQFWTQSIAEAFIYPSISRTV